MFFFRHWFNFYNMMIQLFTAVLSPAIQSNRSINPNPLPTPTECIKEQKYELTEGLLEKSKLTQHMYRLRRPPNMLQKSQSLAY
jgi:hypothetical protein